MKGFYNWSQVAERTEKVYAYVLSTEQRDLWTRIKRSAACNPKLRPAVDDSAFRNASMGPFFGIIFAIILVVDCLFFLFLEWAMPRVDIDYVKHDWNQDRFMEVRDFKI